MYHSPECVTVWASHSKPIHSLLSPLEPKDVSLTDIIKQMGDHYQPKPSVIVQCF